jgi:predicted nucleotidyltransferase
MVDLAPEYLKEIRTMISALFPEREVRVFGSRTTGKAQRYSDLDLLIMGDAPLSSESVEQFRDSLSESDLPIMVDVVEYSTLDEKLKTLFSKDSVRIWPE